MIQKALAAYCYRPQEYQKYFSEMDVEWIPVVKNTATIEVILNELMQDSSPFCIYPVKYRDLLQLVKNQLILSLDEYFDENELSRYAPLALDACRVDGKLVAIPEDIRYFGLISRPDLLNQHGFKHATSGEEFKKQLIDLQKITGKPILAMNGGGLHNRLGLVSSLLAAFGIDLSSPLEEWPENRMLEAYEWIKELHSLKLILNFNYFVRGLDTETCVKNLRDGDILYSCSWIYSQTHWGEDLYGKMGVSLLPSCHPNANTCIPIHGSAWVIPANTKDPVKALELLKKTQREELFKANEMSLPTAFTAWKSLWNDPDINRKYNIYRYSSLFDKPQKAIVVGRGERRILLLEESLCSGIRENLSGKAWLRLVFSRQFKTSRRLISHDLISKAIDYMENNLKKIRGTKDVAAHLQLSPKYFNQLFQRKMKVGCATYLMRIRMERAQELLKDPRLSIKHVSTELGFRYSQSFSRSFRKYFGKNPTRPDDA